MILKVKHLKSHNKEKYLVIMLHAPQVKAHIVALFTADLNSLYYLCQNTGMIQRFSSNANLYTFQKLSAG